MRSSPRQTPIRRSRKIVGGASIAVVATVVALLVSMGTAFAHHPILRGTAVCNSDGTWTVSWDVFNPDMDHPMLVRSVSVSTGHVHGNRRRDPSGCQ
jgi:hypothetical protein